ncbi:efflux RND transporter periplasmic adaptor subunit [Methyloversatilis sp.]|uniref:efflux RND transporter periplasmic adaptor subunit n=1 Tax=Methyloversatilis sp. TaxID=2569862 RepID=UPI0027335087|nr:efflux RND transporter periplasmic adaptor subunit [Methyloversatilis sp.]MDP2870774.1 efflux RND transporter periplasmic adaptor subunit [Methyloversatilis sp.]MDP3287000.1 efflux RND transporter periplasmic adaptor subunit [Methyloversatilis sp.]MDP3455533.1 efflux RND transporter periplasmic adaptor subunit [Methyloversatilis sp.]MDP3578148.1 efflux RND transporter periplasmic adaptor subunit [Methyloversatilis sp.]
MDARLLRLPAVIGIVFAIPAVLALAACTQPAQPDPRTGVPRVAVAVVQPDRAASQSYTGVVTSRVVGDLGFRVAGKVVERLVDTGQTVRRGQPLMRLDAADLDLALAAQAAAVEAARAHAVQARADEQRLRGMVEQGAVSAQVRDQAVAGADSAQALLDAALAQQQVARNAAGYTLLVADSDGVVVDTLVEPGQVVRAGEPVVRLARSGAREALVNLPESVRPAVGTGATATLHSLPGTTFTARLRQLSDAADPRSRTFEARYLLDGAAAQAPIGSTVTLALDRMSGDAAGERVRVPIAALHDAGQGPGVWVIERVGDASRVAFRPVTLAGLGHDSASISAGLRVGERIVALGAHLLRDGSTVRGLDTALAGVERAP